MSNSIAESHVGARFATAGCCRPVVGGIRPLDPVLCTRTQPSRASRRPRRPAACGSTARRRSRRACRSPAPARRRQYSLPRLVAAVREQVAVLTLRPDLDLAAEVLAQRSNRCTGDGPNSSGTRASCPDLAAQSRVAYSTFSKGQSDSTHALTALHSGASSSASPRGSRKAPARRHPRLERDRCRRTRSRRRRATPCTWPSDFRSPRHAARDRAILVQRHRTRPQLFSQPACRYVLHRGRPGFVVGVVVLRASGSSTNCGVSSRTARRVRRHETR